VITASRLELARACPGFAALPHYDTPTPESEAGHARHASREDEILRGAVPDVLAERWPDLTWRAEVKFALDLATGHGRELGTGTDRDYSSAGPFEVCGTADAVGTAEGRLVVVDWKGHDPNVSRASVNAQLHVAALALSRALDLDEATVAIHHEVRGLDVAELDLLQLEQFLLDARQILGDAARAKKDHQSGLPLVLNEGAWCRWCPAFDACPKKQAFRREVELVVASDEREAMLVSFQSDEDAAAAYDFAKRARMLLRRLDAALYARAQERPIPLPSGKIFGPVQKLGNEKLDGPTLHAVVAQRHGREIADASVILSATKVRLREALGFVGKAVATEERAILDEVRRRGGAKRETKWTTEEHDPNPKSLPKGEKRP
jgi:hypothetical protein